MIIVDSSVALKWFLPEEGSEEAKDLLRKDSLGAPDLLLYEVSNALTCEFKLTLKDIQEALQDFYALKIQLFILPEKGFYRTLEISRHYELTSYDASFIALAEALKRDLITADQKLLKKVRSLSFVHSLT